MTDITCIIAALKRLLEESNIDSGHGLDHSLHVLHHAREALKYELDLTEEQKYCIELAALLHDADDNKFFPTHSNYENARLILNGCNIPSEHQDLIITMISLVSCRHNRNSKVDPPWLLIPRWSDRIEALGNIGLLRCYQYSIYANKPMFLESTPRVINAEELNKVATAERFATYQGISESLIDHLYDKVLHLYKMETSNSYLKSEALKRHQIIIDFVYKFGQIGNLDWIDWENLV